MARYKADHAGWRVAGTVYAGDDVAITTEITDAIETYTDGHTVRWTDGCYRVSVTGIKPKPRARTFIGEMAWANAQRLVEDLRNEYRTKGW